MLNVDGENFTSFCPVRIFLNYDGGPAVSEDTFTSLLKIMCTAFRSSSVGVIVSARTNYRTFKSYYNFNQGDLFDSVLKCIYVPGCGFGGSHFGVKVFVFYVLFQVLLSSTFIAFCLFRFQTNSQRQ